MSRLSMTPSRTSWCFPRVSGDEPMNAMTLGDLD